MASQLDRIKSKKQEDTEDDIDVKPIVKKVEEEKTEMPDVVNYG